MKDLNFKTCQICGNLYSRGKQNWSWFSSSKYCSNLYAQEHFGVRS